MEKINSLFCQHVEQQTKTQVISKNNQCVQEIINENVNAQLNQRKEWLSHALNLIKNLQKEINKAKPDIEGGYDAEGKALPNTWSKNAYDKNKNNLDKLSQIVGLVDEIYNFKPESDIDKDSKILENLYSKLANQLK